MDRKNICNKLRGESTCDDCENCEVWTEQIEPILNEIRADERAKIVDKFNKELMHWEDWILAESPSGFHDAKEFSADDMARMVTRTIRECSDVVNEIIAEINSNK